MSDKKPRLTLDARLFLAFAGVVHFILKVLFKVELQHYEDDADFCKFEYDRRKQFVESFPDGIDVRGKRVLDLGCGKGGETVGYAEEGTASIVGVEIDAGHLPQALGFAGEKVPGGAIAFVAADGRALPFRDCSFDLIVMHDVLEHLKDPLAVFRECRRVLVTGGRICLAFGPLWYSPYGGHGFYFNRVPWSALLVPERTIFNARSKFRDDGARTYEETGLFKMSVKKFERLLRQCDMDVVYLELRASKGLTAALKLPVLRELFCREIGCILEKP